MVLVLVVGLVVLPALFGPGGLHTSLPPGIELGNPTASGLGEGIPVVGAHDVLSTDTFRVNMAVNGTFGTPTSAPATGGMFAVVTVGSAYYRVNWTDQDGSGTISTGDSFQVVHTDVAGISYLPFASPASFEFVVLRSDGGAFVASWSVG